MFSLHPVCSSWFIPTIIETPDAPCPPPKRSPIACNFTDEEAARNNEVLQYFDCDTDLLIEDNPGTELAHGGDFHLSSILHPLLYLRPDWLHIVDALIHGVSPSFDPASDGQRQIDNDNACLREKHTSAKQSIAILLKKVKEDIAIGF